VPNLYNMSTLEPSDEKDRRFTSRRRSSSGYIVTGCASALGSSTGCARRISVGLSVIPRSNCSPSTGSREARDRVFEDEELVRAESLREALRRLDVSWDTEDFFFRRIFRPGFPALSCECPEDEEPETVCKPEPDLMEDVLVDPDDLGC
jgi:hypothetical protein